MRGFIYIMANKYDSVLYTGVTSDLKSRVKQHKQKKHTHSFSARYSTFKLVYYEECDTIGAAIKREKQIKGGSRKKKLEMINGANPEWRDLSSLVDEKQD